MYRRGLTTGKVSGPSTDVKAPRLSNTRGADYAGVERLVVTSGDMLGREVLIEVELYGTCERIRTASPSRRARGQRAAMPRRGAMARTP